ncbi:MAG: DUF3871 family protein [Chitinophagaceae bacterium]
MEYTILETQVQQEPPSENHEPAPHNERAFILANTVKSSREEMKRDHVIPVFIKDNEPVLSHVDFIEIMQQATLEVFSGETILKPAVRLSHPIKGRIPEAKNKAASELLHNEKTLYYERMAFTIEIDSVQENVSGNALKLMVGGVKAYNKDNLYSKKGADEHFKIFIGFQNTVCTNLCVWSDGYVGDLKVKDAQQLKNGILKMFYEYDMNHQLTFLHGLDNYALAEQQFAQLIGRCRLYQHLSYQKKLEIPAIQLSDTQLNVVAKDYYNDNSFCRDDNGQINLWRLYNLFTGANKSSYIDTFLDRTVNATTFIGEIKQALAKKSECWFLN